MPSQSGTPYQYSNHGFHLFYMQLLSPKLFQQINGTQNYKLRMRSIWPTIFAWSCSKSTRTEISSYGVWMTIKCIFDWMFHLEWRWMTPTWWWQVMEAGYENFSWMKKGHELHHLSAQLLFSNLNTQNFRTPYGG